MKHDITNREDVVMMVDTFYGKVKTNNVIGFIFSDVAMVDWDKHLPTMYSFWASMVLEEHSYTGNPMIKHIELSRVFQLKEEHFNEWLLLFTATVDELFVGPKATETKARAANIARLMLYKVSYS